MTPADLEAITRLAHTARELMARLNSLLEAIKAMPAASPVKAAYTPDEFAAFVGRTPAWVRGQIRLGRIPTVRGCGRNKLIPASARERFATGGARIAG